MRPSEPNIDLRQILSQFWLDISGKEVQEAATYSYLWLAIQVAHAGLLLALYFLLLRLLQISGSVWLCEWQPAALNGVTLFVLLAATAIWEVFSFLRVWQASRNGPFPPDTGSILKNAVTATFYMWIGAWLGFVSQLASSAAAVVATLLLLVVFIWQAIPWLRQKIIWQKAALPYVSRFATLDKTIDGKGTQTIKHFFRQPLPPKGAPRQLIIFGGVGVGRTQLAAALGTEFAFTGRKVRYLVFERFRGLVRDNAEYPGPKNIVYWPWRDSQLLIIDDVSPSLLGNDQHDPHQSLAPRLEQFMDDQGVELRNALGNRSTVWVVTNDESPDAWRAAVQRACASANLPEIVELKNDQTA